MSLLNDIYKKLFTKEDHFNFHKSVGISCLVSYLVRFAQVGESDMAFGATLGTLLTILMHTTLSVSSLIFRIPLKRIASGYRIWPEYRLHSIIFACRSLLTMLLTWVETRQGWEPNYLLNCAIVLGTIAAADLGSIYVGPAGRSSTIQDLEAPPPVRFFFSAMQFHATMGCLLATRRFSTQFIYVWIVQFNAFLMTLRRKNLAPHSVLVTTYGLMLIFGFVVASYEAHRFGSFLMVNTLGNLAGSLRLGLRMPKYCLWIAMAALTQVSRVSVEQPAAYGVPWLALYLCSVVSLIAVGARKIRKANASAPKTDAASVAKPDAARRGDFISQEEISAAGSDASAADVRVLPTPPTETALATKKLS